VICGDDEYTEAVILRGAQGSLKYISKYGVGLDKIELEVAKKYNIPVTNCPGINYTSVAEHVLALLFTFEKNVHLQYNSTRQGSWKRWVGHEISGKTIGIIGLGAIGKELTKKSLALGLDVMAYDVYKDAGFLETHQAVLFTDKIDLIFEKADIISLHLPHTPETEKLINREVIFEKIKKVPIIINTARGKLVDSEMIIEGLEKGLIRGYLTDVLAQEPMSPDEPLRGIDNVIITPHVGSRTYQSVEKQGLMAVNNLLKCIREGENQIN